MALTRLPLGKEKPKQPVDANTDKIILLVHKDADMDEVSEDYEFRISDAADRAAIAGIVSKATVLERVVVLTPREHQELRDAATKWKEYEEWRKAKATYEHGKGIFEVVTK